MINYQLGELTTRTLHFIQIGHRLQKKAGIKLNPHKARHWFVTSMLRGIYEQSETGAQIEDKKKQLIEYMKWRDPETLNVYEHFYDAQKFRDLHEKLQENYMKREKEYFKLAKTRTQAETPALQTAGPLEGSENKNDWLSDFFEGMEPYEFTRRS